MSFLVQLSVSLREERLVPVLSRLEGATLTLHSGNVPVTIDDLPTAPELSSSLVCSFLFAESNIGTINDGVLTITVLPEKTLSVVGADLTWGLFVDANNEPFMLGSCGLIGTNNAIEVSVTEIQEAWEIAITSIAIQ